MKKYQFQKYLTIIIVILGILLIADYILKTNFFTTLLFMFMFMIGISLGVNVELE